MITKNLQLGDSKQLDLSRGYGGSRYIGAKIPPVEGLLPSFREGVVFWAK